MVSRGSRVKDFSYSNQVIDALQASLSRERLGTCLDAAGGDREGAIRLHVWNTAVSAAFYGPLQGLEVALRNAIHRRLAERYGEAWYDNPGAGLDRGALERIEGARTELARDHERIIEVTGWVSPDTRTWIEHHSRVHSVLETARNAREIRF